MPTVKMGSRVLDARPDRVDLRDRVYLPRVRPLPPRTPTPEEIDRYFVAYRRAGMVLDQGQEGACTGFGLAAVINYMLWKDAFDGEDPPASAPPRVSQRMLYQMARIYDEWPGEDYEGSSCRGAMKGWHRHGVCAERLWRYRANRFDVPASGWETDAAQRPLGAYYRVDRESLVDMQAAICEAGALYVSANVHAGWDKVESRAADAEELPMIPSRPRSTGGHAFALVGYTMDGFIVQNSWGPKWGLAGFALLAYEDWVRNGTDAWVAAMGAPMRTASANSSFASRSLQIRTASGRAGSGTASADLDPYDHALVVGNQGRPLSRKLAAETAADSLAIVARENLGRWIQGRGSGTPPKLAIYAHGGLNSEEDAIRRVRAMAPYFLANDIYPLFVVWRTGAAETGLSILEDLIEEKLTPSRGIGDRILEALSEAKDRTFEVIARGLAVKAMWTEMKENAAAGAGAGGAYRLLASELAKVRAAHPGLEVHLVGHSAGSIVLGHLLGLLKARSITPRTLRLFAPACTTGFALRHYARELGAQGALRATEFDVHVLSDARERDDSVAAYGKSLLYLVSRALETAHKTPLLGLEKAWRDDGDAEMWNRDHLPLVKRWVAAAKGKVRLHVHDERSVSDGKQSVPIAHGSFDNDVAVVTATLRGIRRAALLQRVTDLSGV